MRKMNEEMHKDILQLKNLHTKKDKTEFTKQKYIIMKKHSVCESTIYRQLKMVTPGLCSTAPHSTKTRPIREEEILLIHELLLKQCSIFEVRKAMERYTGESYSFTRIAKVRVEIDKRKWPEEENQTGETAFGENLRKLFIEYTMLDLTDPNRTARLKMYDKDYIANCGVIKDAVEMVIYSAENEGQSTPAINRLKMENMLSRKMDLVTKGHYISTIELKALESIRRSLDYTKQIKAHPDHQVLAEVCRELKPGISDIEIFYLADKHQRLIHGSSEDIVPFGDEVRDIIAQEAMDNR